MSVPPYGFKDCIVSENASSAANTVGVQSPTSCEIQNELLLFDNGLGLGKFKVLDYRA